MGESMRFRSVGICGAVLAITLSADLAQALPDVATVLGDFGYSAADVETLKAGKIAKASLTPASPRELVGAFAFFVKIPPAELAKELKGGLLGTVDANESGRGRISGDGSVADFAKLSLTPETKDRVEEYLEADDDLNLSADEAAAFKQLAAAGTKSTADVEGQVRAALVARYQAYKAKGIAGIAPYAREGGRTRSCTEEIDTANKASTTLRKYAPAAYALLTGYPSGKAAGFDEQFSWTQFSAHEVPTIALVHGMYMPDGDGIVAIQRQYYVSEGFNCEQAIAGFFPVEGGTVVIYGNRTSTDQVEGTGGSLKRSIGSKLLASELEGLFGKLQGAAK